MVVPGMSCFREGGHTHDVYGSNLIVTVFVCEFCL